MKFVFNCGMILFMFSFVFGCSSFCHQSQDYEKIADKITEKTAKKLKDQKNLVLIGTGGQMMHDIQAMDMSFNYYHEVDLKTARELIIYAINEYLSEINDDEKIRPYLHEYPFTAKNVEIRIFIYGPDRLKLPPEKIYCITSLNGTLEYYTRSDHYHPICEETYQEAQWAISSE